MLALIKTKLTDIAVKGKTIIPKGSLLYSFKLSVGQMAFTTKDIYTNEAIFSVFPSEKLNLNYYYYLLDRILIHNSNENIYGAKILNQELIKASKLLVPSEEEQTIIANYLDHKTTQIEHLIAKKEQFIQLLEEERVAIINQAVTKGLDPNVSMKDSGIEWLGEIPEHWEVKKLRFIGNCQNGISAGAEYFGTGYPFVSYGDVYKNEILPISVNGLAQSNEKEQLHYSIDEGDVLFTRTSETIEEIGISSICFQKIHKA
jgi:type I restriction enzyme S subunit